MATTQATTRSNTHDPRATTFLDPQETTADVTTDPYRPDPTHQNPTLTQTFRHSHWQHRRTAILHALQRNQVSPKRLERFAECGSLAWVQRSIENPDRHRITTNKCRDRWCEACQTEHRRTIAANLAGRLPHAPLRFITLTLRQDNKPLRERLTRLHQSFRRLRQSRCWRKHVTGGIAFLEIKLAIDNEHWHPHLHIIAAGDFMPQKVLSEAWKEATGDSHVVDIRFIRDPKTAASYVLKYAAKQLPTGIVYQRDRFDEAIAALSSTRKFNTFGDWTKLRLSKLPPDTDNWETLDSLAHMIERAKLGDVAAREILSLLRFTTDATCSDPPDNALPP